MLADLVNRTENSFNVYNMPRTKATEKNAVEKRSKIAELEKRLLQFRQLSSQRKTKAAFTKMRKKAKRAMNATAHLKNIGKPKHRIQSPTPMIMRQPAFRQLIIKPTVKRFKF